MADSLPDTEMLNGNHFCDCEAGKSAKLLAERRAASWQEWQSQNKQVNDQRREREKLILGSPIPWTLEDASIKGLRVRARDGNGEVDPEKRIAIDLAELLRTNGEVSSKNEMKRNSILIFGAPGVGKTGCLMPVFLDWRKKGRDTYFVDFKHLMRMVRDGYKARAGEPTASEVINRACSADVLFLDDVGHTWEDEIKPHSVQVVGDIIRYRHAKKLATLMTTNLAPNDLARQITSEIFQRIAEMAVIVKMGGKVLRQLN